MKVCALLSLAMSIVALTLPCAAQRAALADAPLPTGSDLTADTCGDDAAAAVVPMPPPDQPLRLRLLDWTLIGMASTLRVLDYTSTERGIQHPRYVHEAELPSALVHNKPAFAAFEAGTVALNFAAYRLLVRHNMRSLARVSQYMYVGVMTGQVVNNYRVVGGIPAQPANP